MHTDNRLVDIRHLFGNVFYQYAELVWYRIAGGIRNIQNGRTGIDNGLEYPIEILRVRSAGIFRVELNLVGILQCVFHRFGRHLNYMVFFLFNGLSVLVIAEFPDDMDIGYTKAGMDTISLGRRYGLAARIDIRRDCPRKPADDRPIYLGRNERNSLKVLRRRDRKPGLYNINAQPGQLSCDFQLFTNTEPAAGGLFAIPQSRIEDHYFFISRHFISPVLFERWIMV